MSLIPFYHANKEGPARMGAISRKLMNVKLVPVIASHLQEWCIQVLDKVCGRERRRERGERVERERREGEEERRNSIFDMGPRESQLLVNIIDTYKAPTPKVLQMFQNLLEGKSAKSEFDCRICLLFVIAFLTLSPFLSCSLSLSLSFPTFFSKVLRL